MLETHHRWHDAPGVGLWIVLLYRLVGEATDRVQRFLENAGVAEKQTRNNPQKAKPGKAAQERAEAKAAKAAAAAESTEEAGAE